MTIPTSTDVLVVGAGPTGLSLAVALQTAGLTPLVVDRAETAGSDSRAAIVHIRTLELLESLGVAESLARRSAPIAGATYYDAGLAVCDLSFAALGSQHRCALGVSQHEVENTLTERLVELGGTVHRPVTMESMTERDGGMVVQLTDGAGELHEVRTRYLVGCDGAASAVRDQSGLAGPGTDIAETYVIADVPVRGPLDPEAMHLFAAGDGFLVLSRLPDDLWRFTATMPDATKLPTREQLQLLLSDRGPRTSSVTIGEPAGIGRYRVRRSVVERMRQGPVMLAGDAAHTFAPAGGQGMNVGIADAVNLAWKLALVCGDGASEDLLDSYDLERRPAAQLTVDRTQRLGGALSLHHPLARGLRDAVALLARRVDSLTEPVLRGLSGFDTVYESGAVEPGTRGARGWGGPGERAPSLTGIAPAEIGHRLLAARAEDLPLLDEVAAGRAVPIAVEAVESAGLVGAALVRPDGHVGWVGRADDVGSLDDYLDRYYPRV